MSYKKQFSRELNILFKIRTHWLAIDLFEMKPKPILSESLNNELINATILKMQNIAAHALTKTWSNVEFKKSIKQQKAWKIQGKGSEEQKENFKEWFEDNFGDSQSYVYSFWTKKKKTCLYVGRSTNGRNRCTTQFNDRKTLRSEWVEIYIVNKSDAVKMECLAIHHFEPKHNENKAASSKYTKSCPLCDVHKHINSELKSIFKLKK